MLEDTLPAGHVLLPKALVVSAVRPHLQPEAAALRAHPVALVPGAALEDVLPSEDSSRAVKGLLKVFKSLKGCFKAF